MRAWQPLSLKRIGVGMALAILAWAAAPGSAYASCGDYVVMGSGHSESGGTTTDSVLVPRGGPSGVHALPPCSCLPTPFDKPPIPCPGCSAPSPSESAAVPVPTQPRDDGAIAIADHIAAASPVGPALLACECVPFASPILGIFRPPRLAA